MLQPFSARSGPFNQKCCQTKAGWLAESAGPHGNLRVYGDVFTVCLGTPLPRVRP